MTGAEDAGRHSLLHRGRQVQEPQRVTDVRPGTTNPLGQLLMGGTEVIEQLLIGRCLFEWIELLAMQVLDERVAEQLGVGSVPDNSRDLHQTGALRRPPAALAHDQLVLAAADRAYDYGLEEPYFTDRVS